MEPWGLGDNFNTPIERLSRQPTCLLTHWGRVTHICASKIIVISSDNDFSPGRCQAIIWTNAWILLNGPIGTNFSEMLIKICTCSIKKMHLKMSAIWRRCYLGLNVLTHWGRDKMAAIFQTIFSNGLSWMKMFEFWSIFNWSLFPRVHYTRLTDAGTLMRLVAK